MVDLWGNSIPEPQHNMVRAVQNQLRAIMREDPSLIDDEDGLAAEWVRRHVAIPLIPRSDIAQIIRRYRKADIRRRRQELRHEFPYSDEEESRRQRVARR